MRTLLGLIALTTLTSGCASTPFKPVCPQIVEYTAAEQDQIAGELILLPKTGIVRSRVMPDAGRMRDEVRACRKG